jgi:iron complex transport system permease protein
MNQKAPDTLKRLVIASAVLLIFFLFTLLVGISVGSSGSKIFAGFRWLLGKMETDPLLNTIIWEIRFPRVMLAALVGATLSLGGLVFQALLRNPLAEPYILGISGGAAIGAILGILLGFARFPGVTVMAFAGSMATLVLLIIMTSGTTVLMKDSLLLSGVMVNAFCSAFIMFLVSLTQDARLHNIIFWLMGDMGIADMRQVGILAGILIPCFFLFFFLSNAMNLLTMGKETAQAIGVNVQVVNIVLLVVTSLMISAAVSHCGLIGFVGLVMPHLLRLILGPDHRILVPACILGGGGYMVLCDLLARSLPRQGEMPVGVITAMIGAPLFVYLLKRSRR